MDKPLDRYDTFAMHAMTALIQVNAGDDEWIARRAYDIAFAMLQESNRMHGTPPEEKAQATPDLFPDSPLPRKSEREQLPEAEYQRRKADGILHSQIFARADRGEPVDD